MISLIIKDQFGIIQNLQTSPIPQTSHPCASKQDVLELATLRYLKGTVKQNSNLGAVSGCQLAYMISALYYRPTAFQY